MVNLINGLVPAVLMAAGVLVMAMSSLIGGGVSAYVGLPLFIVGFLWLLIPVYRRRGHRP